MTAKFQLGLPTDIPWKKIGVSTHMMDRKGADQETPPQWNSSIAIFEHVPEEAYQPYDDMEVTYLKVTATITGYQPSESELKGAIDWKNINTTTVKNVKELLSEFLPCTGAVLQVTVSPEDESLPFEQYPYFSDFQPKQRNLYELASDSHSLLSRSGENLVVGKSGVSTSSLEVLDLDMGFSAGGSAGIGGKASASLQFGQNQTAGTKILGSNERATNRMVDRSQEKRESESFTTQLSQVYSQLQSYHVGTNRALFLMQPRPHTVAQDNGFVRGVNALDGIQEFFLVAVKPKGQKIYVTVKLDTAHLTDVDMYEYDYQVDHIEESVIASPPSSPDDEFTTLVQRDRKATINHGHLPSDDVFYDYYEKVMTRNLVYTPKFNDYVIDVDNRGGYEIIESSVSSASRAQISAVKVSPDGSSLNATLTARSSRGFYPKGVAWGYSAPNTYFSEGASAKLSLKVNLKSKQPTRKIGRKQVLLIATNGVTTDPNPKNQQITHGILQTKPVSSLLADSWQIDSSNLSLTGKFKEHFDTVLASNGNISKDSSFSTQLKQALLEEQRRETMTITTANALSNALATALREKATEEIKMEEVKPYVLTDVFAGKLYNRTVQVPERKKILEEAVKPELVRVQENVLQDVIRRPLNELTREELFNINTNKFVQLAKMNENLASIVKLEALGLKFEN